MKLKILVESLLANAYLKRVNPFFLKYTNCSTEMNETKNYLINNDRAE